MTFFFKKLARSLCFCAPVCCIVILLPAVSIVSQPIQTRQITEKQVRISLPEQLRGSAGNTVRTEKLSGYTLNGKFVPDGQVLLNHGKTRTALQGRYRDGKPEERGAFSIQTDNCNRKSFTVPENPKALLVATGQTAKSPAKMNIWTVS